MQLDSTRALFSAQMSRFRIPSPLQQQSMVGYPSRQTPLYFSGAGAACTAVALCISGGARAHSLTRLCLRCQSIFGCHACLAHVLHILCQIKSQRLFVVCNYAVTFHLNSKAQGNIHITLHISFASFVPDLRPILLRIRFRSSGFGQVEK